MNDTELLLIDLSSIAHPIWHMSQGEPDPNATSTKVVDRVRALASQHPHAAVCCDSGKSFRAEIDPAYKAQRPQQDAALQHQIRVARERLVADGFPVWAVKGFEADDLIATATTRALAIEGTRVLIASADKDLLQLVNERVRALSVTNGVLFDADAVAAKFGVRPGQMLDYLSLVGDTSDNIKGAHGIGPKKAAALLGAWGTLDDIYAGLAAGPHPTLVGARAALEEFRPRLDTVRLLIALRTDAEIPFEEIACERTPPTTASAVIQEDATMSDSSDPTVSEGFTHPGPVALPPPGAMAPAMEQRVVPMPGVLANAAVVPQPSLGSAASAPQEWEKQLEPRSMGEAFKLSQAMYQARLFNGYGAPEAVLSTVMAGRELGLPAVASLRGFAIVDGKHCLSADLIRALVLKSGLAEYFKCIERTAERATFKTHRRHDPDPDPTVLTFTIEEARTAFGFVPEMPAKEREAKDAKWKASGYGKNPSDMLVARSGAKLARLVYPEVCFGLYDPSELER